MKRNLVWVIASALSVASFGGASAADLAARPYVKAPPPPPPVFSWTGFYIGINGGGGSSHNCWDFIVDESGAPVGPAAEGCHNATGGTFGGQIGYRWQFTNWVVGVEGQGNWADFSGGNDSLLNGTTVGVTEFNEHNRTRINSFGLITGQVGYAWNNVLLYVKGGGAVTDNRYAFFDLDTGLLDGSASETRWGGTVGAGVEVGFWQGWSVGIEYDHLFMGSRNVSFIAPDGAFAGT